MITLEPITKQNILTFKAARLQALQDTPSAFGSTYAKESALTDADWLKRAERWNGQRAVLYIAMDGTATCGIAGGSLDEADAAQVNLISMWTAPTHRRRGVARMLVEEILRWARARSARTMRLLVTSNNDRAISFYKGLGFTLSGRTEPYPNDPTLIEYEMSLSII